LGAAKDKFITACTFKQKQWLYQRRARRGRRKIKKLVKNGVNLAEAGHFTPRFRMS
jgi:hypothetical protein